MPRKHLFRSSEFPYHVTARSNNKEDFPFDLAVFWKVLCDQAYWAQVLFEAHVHALVLMPNHIHMLMSTPQEDLGKIMQEYMRSITQIMNLKSGRSGRIFGASYHWTLIDSPIYFAHAYKYVYRNPVKAKLCTAVEDYAFSTIESLTADRRVPFPLWYPFGRNQFVLIPNDYAERLAWLNSPFRKEQEEEIKKGLRKTKFQPPRTGWKRTLSELKEMQLV